MKWELGWKGNWKGKGEREGEGRGRAAEKNFLQLFFTKRKCERGGERLLHVFVKRSGQEFEGERGMGEDERVGKGRVVRERGGD